MREDFASGAFSISTSSSSSAAAAAAVAAALVIASGSAIALARTTMASREQRRQHRAQIDRLQQLRHEERTGRIRAEVRLRAALKEIRQQRCHRQGPGVEEEENDGAGIGDGDRGDALDGGDESGAKGATARATAAEKREVTTMLMTSIGTVASPFVKRMGTPRQPQLAPSARGYVEFHRRGAASPSSLDGIGEYSHAWILFEFHANTNSAASGGSGGTGGTKIRPPRAPPHVKVGQLASRSPHRPNPIGLSLVRIDKWDARNRRLHVSGLDLVHGTPVYDVKPYVPWDAPGYCCRGGGGQEGDAPTVRVPAWVSQEDELSRVELTGDAERQLRECVQAGRLAPFYPPDREGDGEDGGGLEAARSLLAEVLRQDPRGSHRGGGKGGGGNDRRGEESSPGGAGDGYSLLLGRCRVFFAVSPSAGLVTVTRVEGADLDPATTPHAEGVPLLMVPAAGRSGGAGAAGPSG